MEEDNYDHLDFNDRPKPDVPANSLEFPIIVTQELRDKISKRMRKMWMQAVVVKEEDYVLHFYRNQRIKDSWESYGRTNNNAEDHISVYFTPRSVIFVWEKKDFKSIMRQLGFNPSDVT